MATADSVKAKIQTLIDTANAKTGGSDTDLTTAVGALVEGYGSGSSAVFTSKVIGRVADVVRGYANDCVLEIELSSNVVGTLTEE